MRRNALFVIDIAAGLPLNDHLLHERNSHSKDAHK